MAKAPPTTEARFDGFADARLSFFRSLAKHQDREWFAAHKAEYEEGWHKPMLALLGEAREALDKLYRHCELAWINGEFVGVQFINRGRASKRARRGETLVS